MNLISIFKQIIFKYKWSKATPNQKAEMMRDKFYSLGKNVELYTSHFGTEPYLISIEDNVTVAANVKFINHDVSCFNMARVLGIDKNRMDKVGCIVLHENCFIGAYAILLPGCSVGKNSVIGAGSVVTGHIPDNEVWGGNPARFIMKTIDYAKKVEKNALNYPWKYDAEGNLLNLSSSEIIKMRQDILFQREKNKRNSLFNN